MFVSDSADGLYLLVQMFCLKQRMCMQGDLWTTACSDLALTFVRVAFHKPRQLQI